MPSKLYPRLTLALLTALNVLNYVDRAVLFGVQPLIQKEFQVNDFQVGFLNSAFFISYLCAAPFVGLLGDKYARKKIVAIGIIIWSGFTLLSAITHTYNELLFRHIMVGVGEASYAVIAPTLIADSFPIQRRGRMLAVFNFAVPFGAALGIGLGSLMGVRLGWRAPFMVAGIPGFLLAVVLWLLPEPERGKTDSVTATEVRSTLPGLLRNGAFVTATLGLAMYTFALGGLQQWMPTFLSRVRHIPLGKAGLIFSAMTCIVAIIATLSGGWLGDMLLKRNHGAYYTLSGVAMLVGVPLMIVAIYMTGWPMYPAMCAAEFFLLLNTGPLNAAIVNSVSAQIRSTALAINVVVIHLLGDVPSPSIIGWVSDKAASLQKGFWVTFLAAALSGIILVYGSRYAPQLSDRKTAQRSTG
ncbi:MAG TPA: MFS transporter [Candidatus Angelobacter sp.]|nr:MFS transporter [Candidatus Angelobacter sp.]